MRLVVVALAVLFVASCGGGEGGSATDAAGAEEALETQRADVRAAAAGLGEAVRAEVDGRVVDSRGTYEGCESAFNEEFATFRYAATVRIAGGAGRDLEALAEQHAADGVDVSLRAVPGGGASGDWLVLATGAECVDVPEGERDQWLTREDPEDPIL